MTTNNTYSIEFQSLKPGVHHFEFDINDHFFEAWPESEVAHGHGRVSVDLTRHLALIELSINISAQVLISCDRCLDEFMLPVIFEGNPLVKITDTPGPDDGDIIWVNPLSDSIDLGQYIYESIILSLPFQRVHPNMADCNQQMLNHFKIVSSEEFDEIAQTLAQHTQADKQAQNPFAALAGLKDKLEK